MKMVKMSILFLLVSGTVAAALIGFTSAETATLTKSKIASEVQGASVDTEPFLYPIDTLVGEVSLTASAGTTSGSFSTLKEAFDAINAGIHQGNIVINIVSSTNEGATPATLNSSGAGAASYATILIRPATDGVTISGSPSQGFGVIQLKGADNVTFDGDNPNTPGINRNLSIAGSGNERSVGIRIANAATVVTSSNDLTIKNLIIDGNVTGRNDSSNTTTASPANLSWGIYVGGGGGSTATDAPIAIPFPTSPVIPSGTTVNSFLANNNAITEVGRAIEFKGNTPTASNGVTISDNQIGNPIAGDLGQVYSFGMTIQGAAAVNIRGNLVYVESYVGHSLRGIDVGLASSNSENVVIEDNRVMRVRNNNGQTFGALGISFGSNFGDVVRNNFITGVANDQTAGSRSSFNDDFFAAGIHIARGQSHRIYNNSVHMTGTIPGTQGANMTTAFMAEGAGVDANNDLRNNIFSNQMTGGNSSPTAPNTRHAAFYVATTVSNWTVNNNAYYTGSGPLSRLAKLGQTAGTGEYQTADFNPAATTPASNFRALTSSFSAPGTNDNASFATTTPPPFVSATDLHLTGGAPVDTGTVIPDVTDDIDGQLRPVGAGYDIGGDEFAVAPTPTPTSTPTPTPTNTPTATPTSTPTNTPTPTPTPTQTTYNASDEFSPTQNGTDRVWRYGYSASHADNAFTAFTQTRTDASCGGQFDAWLVPNNDRVPQINRHSLGLTCAGVPGNALFIHPGQTILGGGDPSRRAVVRWTAPVSGTFQLTGSLQRQNSSATTDLKIIKNAGASESVIYSASNVSTYQIAYNVTVPDVQQGDRLDFSVGDGGNGYNSDGSSIVINIGPPVTACSIAPANLQVFVPGENSPNDVQSNNAGTPVGNATYDTGKVGQALKFDGDGDYVTIADNAAQRPASQLTAEGWFKFDSLSGSLPHLVAKPRRDNNLDSYVLWYDAGNIRIGYTDTDGDFIFHNTGFVPQTGVFNHYAMVLNTEDAGATANTFKLLLNGAEIFSGAADKAILYDANPFPLVIGADLETNTPSFFLNGAADEVSIYNRALTQTEIFNIVRQGSFGKCSGTAACHPAPSGIVSWWKGDGTANDSAGPNNGTLQNGATYATGISGQAFSFNGSNQYMLAGDPIPASLQIQNEISLESWIYVTSYPGDLGVILGSQRDSGINSGATLMLDGRTNPDGQTAPPGHIHFQIGDGSFHVTNANAQVPLNQWVHVLATRRANEDGKIYYNGVLQPSTSAPWNGTISYSGSWFAIGQQKDLNRPFNGLIDESAIYNRALTATEVAGIYAAGSAGMCPIPTPTPTPTGAPAAAGVLNGTISAGQTLTGVTVTYTDNTAINVSTIDHNDIVVTGPNGFNAPASLQSLDNNTNGTPRVAGYLLGSPGGSWDIGDNGTYSIVMNANQVSDTDGAFVAAGVIGTFVVDLNPPPTPTPTNTPTATPTNTPTATPTNTPTATPTSTPTATPTNTPTATPTATPTSTPTATPTNTPTATPTATPTSTPTATPTATPTPSAPTPIILAGADSGQSEICTFDPDGEPRMCFTPFGSTYTGGIRVATGDVNGDGTSDIIAGRATGASHLKVYDGRTSAIIWDFFAFGSHTFGINVASGDVDGDGQDDVIVGPGTGGTPLLHIYSGANGQNVRGFFAYPSTFTGGVRVAAGDLDGDGRSDIITGPGPGGPDVVKVFSGFNGTEIDNFSPFAGFTGGLFVGAGHVNTDGIADVIVGADEGLARAPVRVFNGADLTMIHSILTQVGGTTGVRVGSQDINSDGRDDIVTGSGPGTPGVVKVYDAVDASMIAGFVVYNQRPGGDSPQLGEFQGGISIAAGSISNAAPTPLPTTLSITGVVRQYSESGAFSPQAGATVTLTGTFGASTVTDTAGRYTFQNLPIGGGYTVLTTGLNRSYEPNSHSYSALTASVFNADFVAFAAEIPRQARLESSHTAPGSPVAVPVLISSLGNEKAVDFSVNYDLNPLSSPTVACGTDATGCAIITDTSIPGTLGVRMTLASSPISGDREIARITFQTVATSATNSDITFTDTPTARSIRDSEGNVLSTTYQNGLIVFSQGYEGDLSPRPSGDGAITATDVVLTRSLVAGLTSPNSAFNERQRADTSPAATRGDDQLDATDIVQTRRYSTGLDPVQSAGGPAVGTVGVESNAGPAGGARRVRIVRLSETAKGKLQISIEIDGQGNESAASFTLRYDPAMVMRPIVTASSGNLAAAAAGDGRLGIAIDSTEALKGEIITIAFDMADSTDLSKIDFGFDNSLAVSAISNFTGQRLPVLFEPLHTSRLKE